MSAMQRNNIGKKVALGGILTALGLICLYASNILPTTKLTFGALSSMLIFVMVIEFGVGSAVAIYVATSVLAITIMAFDPIVIFYVVFLGYYGIVKYYIEKINHLWLEWILKVAFFNILIAGLFAVSLNIPFFKGMFNTAVGKYSLWSTIILGEIAFVVYDYGYSVAIGYYKNRLQKLLRL